MSELAQNCENYAILTQNYTLELFIAFKMAYSCCFSFEGNLDFLDILQKKFYNINCWLHCFCFYRWKTAAIRRTWFVTLFLRTFEK